VPIIVSIASEGDPDEFIALARRLDKITAVAALELNISCPNLKMKKLISQDASATASVVKHVRKATGKTLITKLSPNVTDIVQIALSAQDAGSDAVSLINTLQALAIDVDSRRPKIAAGFGGLSGPAIRPIAVRMVHEAYNKIRIPIIGMGGIMDIRSALEFIIAGASAVAIGTANFIEPGIAADIAAGLVRYLQETGVADIKEIIGSLKSAYGYEGHTEKNHSRP